MRLEAGKEAGQEDRSLVTHAESNPKYQCPSLPRHVPVSRLLAIVAALSLGKCRRLARLVLRHLVHRVLVALLRLAVSPAGFGDVDHGCGRSALQPAFRGMGCSVCTRQRHFLPGLAEEKYSGWG